MRKGMSLKTATPAELRALADEMEAAGRRITLRGFLEAWADRDEEATSFRAEQAARVKNRAKLKADLLAAVANDLGRIGPIPGIDPRAIRVFLERMLAGA